MRLKEHFHLTPQEKVSLHFIGPSWCSSLRQSLCLGQGESALQIGLSLSELISGREWDHSCWEWGFFYQGKSGMLSWWKGGNRYRQQNPRYLLQCSEPWQVPQLNLSLDGPLSLLVAAIDADFSIFCRIMKEPVQQQKAEKDSYYSSGDRLCILRGLIGIILERASRTGRWI